MSLIVYLSAAVMGYHCVTQSIKMNFGVTNIFLICSYLFFFGSLSGIVIYTYYEGVNNMIAYFMIATMMMLITDRRHNA